jgi:hypothetical protein
VTIELETLWDDAINTLRDDKYRTATAVKVEVILTGDVAAEEEEYKLTFTFENCYFTAAKPVIGGPERIKVPLSLRAAAIGADEPMVVTLRDLQGTRYLG